MITEGSARLLNSVQDIPDKSMDVFYNPVMKHNRDVSIAVVKHFGCSRIVLPLAGSGVRAVRLLQEVGSDLQIYANDNNAQAVERMRQHMHLNDVKFDVNQLDASLFLLQQPYAHYIDIDPFGSPLPFVDAALKVITHKGIVAVSATDTSALCGASPKACVRKYDAKPLRCYQMHEIGVRILLGKLIRMGAMYEKALVPVLSYAKDHYMRVYMQVHASRSKTDVLLQQVMLVDNEYGVLVPGKTCGVLYMGPLRTLHEGWFSGQEYDTPGFYVLPELQSRLGLLQSKSMQFMLNVLHTQGFVATKTHFHAQGIKTNAPYAVMVDVMKS